MRKGYYLLHHCTIFSYILVHTNYNQLLLKMSRNYPFKRSENSGWGHVIKHHVIYHFGIPRQIISNNSLQFTSWAYIKLCDKFIIQNVVSSPYNLASKGQVEAFNKTIMELWLKFIPASQCNWDEKLEGCLWAYPTIVRIPTRATNSSWCVDLKLFFL